MAKLIEEESAAEVAVDKVQAQTEAIGPSQIRVLVDAIINGIQVKSGQVALVFAEDKSDLKENVLGDDNEEAIAYALTQYPNIIDTTK